VSKRILIVLDYSQIETKRNLLQAKSLEEISLFMVNIVNPCDRLLLFAPSHQEEDQPE